MATNARRGSRRRHSTRRTEACPDRSELLHHSLLPGYHFRGAKGKRSISLGRVAFSGTGNSLLSTQRQPRRNRRQVFRRPLRRVFSRRRPGPLLRAVMAEGRTISGSHLPCDCGTQSRKAHAGSVPKRPSGRIKEKAASRILRAVGRSATTTERSGCQSA